MIRFELKKEVASGRLFIYLSSFVVLYILYFFIKEQTFGSENTIEFIKNAWHTIIIYFFPIIIILLCTNIFTKDYNQGHLKNILLVVKNKTEIWFRKSLATVIIVIILLVFTILLGAILSLFLPITHLAVDISSYFIFFLNTFINLLPIILLFILISIIINKPRIAVIVSLLVYIICITLDMLLKQNSFSPFTPLFSSTSKPLLSISYIILLTIINIVCINKKEIKK